MAVSYYQCSYIVTSAMRMQSPSLSELHAFAAAARLGSFSLAAQELHVTQGAISRAIARLQEHLDLPLFTRDGRHSVLTPEGQAYLDAVAPAIASIESATRAVRQRRQARAQGTLRLSVTPTLFSHWLIPRLPDFTAQHPEIALSFAPYRRDDPLTAPDIDAWIRSGTGHWPAMASDYVAGRELIPICRPADQAAITSPEDLRRRPLLAHTNYPDNWAAWFDGVGCAQGPLQPVADFEFVAQLVQAVIAGLGVAVVQRCLVEADLAAGRIALAWNQGVALPRAYYLCSPLQRPPHAALMAFRAWLVAQNAP
jgi:LysR family glycine cleavage system transcriptional activator